MALPLILAGAAAGLLKSKLVDEPAANAQRKLAARTAELSPWTGMTPTMPQEANAFGSMMQGGMAGAQLGQGLKTAGMQDQLMQNAINQQKRETFIPKAGGPDIAGGRTEASLDYLSSPDYFQQKRKPSSWFGF
jgi:hypothetical protein